MAISKIPEDALNKHVNNPDVPNLSAAELKAFFDQPAEVLKEKINEIIGEGEEAEALSELKKKLTDDIEVLSDRISKQEIKTISFDGNYEYVGMAEELPDGFLWFGSPEYDGMSGYDATISCCIYVSAPEEPSVLNVEHGSFGFKSTDPVGNYVLWIFHKNEQATVSLIYKDCFTGYGVIRRISNFTDTGLSIPGTPADANATGAKITGLNVRLEALEEEIKNAGSTAAGVQGISGNMNIEDLPIGASYAAEDVTLQYLSNGEEDVYSTLSVASGACIIKTLGQIEDSNTGEMAEGAITVYVIPQSHGLWDDYSNQSTLILTKIAPFYDMYGLQYSLYEIKDNIEVVNSISSDPDYGDVHPNHVPNVAAVVDYVAKNGGGSGGGASSGMTELDCWSGSLEDLALGTYYVVDGASFDYYDISGEWTSTSVGNGVILIVGERLDWNAENGRRKFAAVFEPDGYRYLG